MHQLPTELQLYVLQLATDIRRFLEITPNPHNPLLPENRYLDDLVTDHFRQSLPTRRALPLVSRSFNTLATSLLYACILLTEKSTPRIHISFNASQACMVRHVIMDFYPFSPSHLDGELASMFSFLYNVRILSIRAIWPSKSHPPPFFTLSSLTRTMAKSLGPTLRKLVLHSSALFIFFPIDLSAFTSSLPNLEVLIASRTVIPSYPEPPNLRVSLPASLPHLRFLHLDDAPLVLPTGITPSHVHCPLNINLPSVLSPALTHLSLYVPKARSLNTYSSLPTSSPNLISLAFSGFLPDINRVLTEYPLPAVSNLIFAKIEPPEEITDISSYLPEEDMQTWVDAVAMLGETQPAVGLMRVLDDMFVHWLWELASDRRAISVDGLEGCGFTMEDGHGRALLDVIRRRRAS